MKNIFFVLLFGVFSTTLSHAMNFAPVVLGSWNGFGTGDWLLKIDGSTTGWNHYFPMTEQVEDLIQALSDHKCEYTCSAKMRGNAIYDIKDCVKDCD